LISLHRLQLAVKMLSRDPEFKYGIEALLQKFENTLPNLRDFRNIIEHTDEYLVGEGYNNFFDQRRMQVMEFDGKIWRWHGINIDTDELFKSAEALYAGFLELIKGQ